MRVAIWAIVLWLGLNLVLLFLWFAYGRVLWRQRRARAAGSPLASDPPTSPPIPGETGAVLRRSPDLRAQLVDALIAALNDPYAPTRREAVRALKGLGDLRALPALEAASRDDAAEQVRTEARDAVALFERRRRRSQADEVG